MTLNVKFCLGSSRGFTCRLSDTKTSQEMLKCTNAISRTLWAFLCPSNGIRLSFSFFKKWNKWHKTETLLLFYNGGTVGRMVEQDCTRRPFQNEVSRWELTMVFRLFFVIRVFQPPHSWHFGSESSLLWGLSCGLRGVEQRLWPPPKQV